MNLDQIATKCFILALFIRDDGQRLLLGDGYYDFNQKLQHFQGNTIANDIVEIQGDNGQLLAGQVMRSGTQKFEGYIGDATTNRQIIEQKRSDFMAFFRIKHFYKVIYIFPDGTAIQRQRGYLTDAPTIPEIFQKFPEYSVALNFEDANYYEYAEDEHGDEIYAHIIELALSGNATGGLIWDEIGAVTNGISWSGIQTAQGEYIQVTNALDIPAKLASVEMLGKATQAGTPTPTSPQPISVVTGENTVKITGKNLFSGDFSQFDDQGGAGILYTYFELPTDGDYMLTLVAKNEMPRQSASRYIGFTSTGGGASGSHILWAYSGTAGSTAGQTRSIPNYVVGGGKLKYLSLYPKNQATLEWFTDNFDIQLELGSSASQFEPYQGQEFEVNLGKNLFDLSSLSATNITVNATEAYGSASAFNTAFSSTGIDILTPSQFTLSIVGYTDGNQTIENTSGLGFRVGYTDGTYSSYTYWTNNNTTPTLKTFTSDGNKTPDKLYFSFASKGQNIWHLSKIQLEKGTTATTYAPYFTPIELAKIGNYQDRIYKDSGKWYIEKQVGKVVFNGSEADWISEGGGAPYRIPMPDFLRPSPATIFAISDHFESVPYNANWNNYTSLITTNATGSATAFKFRYTAITSLADWKTWLSTHPTTVYYALATPTTTEITNEALIAQLEALGASSLYLGVNNIGTETQNAVPTLKIEYYTEYTLDGAGYEWEPGGNTAKTIVTVAGVDSAWPIWTVQGGAQNPTLTNITTGQTISWQGFVPEGQTLTINMAEMTADLAGANVFEYITGEWLRLAPGNNTLVYNAGNADKPSTLSWNGVLA